MEPVKKNIGSRSQNWLTSLETAGAAKTPKNSSRELEPVIFFLQGELTESWKPGAGEKRYQFPRTGYFLVNLNN